MQAEPSGSAAIAGASKNATSAVVLDAREMSQFDECLKDLGASLFCKPEPLAPVIAITIWLEWLLTAKETSRPSKIRVRVRKSEPLLGDLQERVDAVETDFGQSRERVVVVEEVADEDEVDNGNGNGAKESQKKKN
mmetsp:Transcript_2235/g.5297  ORF Transcript_2235/g.5297 Transcript_2235/m.5297 type:complete len:136 (+) Transcript_2235:4766-5173(+)